ncbi:MAG: CoB--CoM heterodisulfide reductase iron-sulfur subunit A family protein [Candidatus Eiseniibacteriota bacterium]|nr:MAG: CoB--CoM heterodisulfide reductase iron-sulfur subunit A family protein [Candidatus Eisenbacteria bacterium]
MAHREGGGRVVKAKVDSETKTLPRIGVFLCHCGSEIRDSLDLSVIERHVRKLPGVAFVRAAPYPCSRPGIAEMLGTIKKHGLERILVAGCTPRLHGKLFADACESAGVNRWLVEIVNIREHCSRVHKNRREATGKAKALVQAGLNRLHVAETKETVRVTPLNSVLVVGGGLSGISAAAELAGLNHEVTLIEKAGTLGGMLTRILRPHPHVRTGKEILQEKLFRIEGKVDVLTQTTLASLKGGPGQYRATLSSNGKSDERNFGAVIVATGAQCPGVDELPWRKAPAFGGRLLPQMELEAEEPEKALESVGSIIFLNVLPRGLGGSVTRLSSLVALKNAVLLRERKPALELTFVFEQVPRDLEREFRRARESGVKFARHADGKPPEFTKTGLRLRDEGGKHIELKTDAVVLPAVLVPSEKAGELSEILRIPVDEKGFFVEPHVKLRPEEFIERGVFIAGSCHSPASILECTAQAMAAASRASRFLSGESFKAPLVSRIDENVCRGCGRCAEECRWDAIEMESAAAELKLARVDETLCSGCGVCSTVCICGAPTLAPVALRQIRDAVKAAVD